jgi:hypothetical protein
MVYFNQNLEFLRKQNLKEKEIKLKSVLRVK